MPIAVKCGSCQGTFRVRDELAGKRVKCKCGAVLPIPTPGASQPGTQPTTAKSQSARPQRAKTQPSKPKPQKLVVEAAPKPRPAPNSVKPTPAPQPVAAAPAAVAPATVAAVPSARIAPAVRTAPAARVPTIAAAPAPAMSSAPATVASEDPLLSKYTKRRGPSVPVWAWFAVAFVAMFGALGYVYYDNTIGHEREVAEQKAAKEARREKLLALQRKDEIKPRTTGFSVAPDEKAPLERPGPDASQADIIAFVKHGIVRIETSDQYGNRTGLGSGFVIDTLSECGVVATNYHVIRDAVKADVAFDDGTRFGIEGYLAVAPELDLAILKMNGAAGDMQVLSLVTEGDPRAAEEVYSIGHPHGHQFRTTRGIVSAVTRTRELPAQSRAFVVDSLGDEVDHRWICHDAKIAPGNSGGPLLNRQGDVMGINTWVNVATQEGYALHAWHLEQLKAKQFSAVRPLTDFYRPAEEEVAAVRIPVAHIQRLVRELAAADWLPSDEEDYEKMQLLAYAATYDELGEGVEQLITSLQQVDWDLDRHVSQINAFAQPRLSDRGAGVVLFGSIRKVDRTDGTTKVLLSLPDRNQLVFLAIDGVRSDIHVDSQILAFGISLGKFELSGEGGQAASANIVASRFMVGVDY